MNIGFDGTDRRLDDQLDADGRREVKHGVAAIDVLRHHRFVEDGVDHAGEVWMRPEVIDVGNGSGRQVVDRDDLMAVVEQAFREVGTDKAGAASNHDVHRTSPFECSVTFTTGSYVAKRKLITSPSWTT